MANFETTLEFTAQEVRFGADVMQAACLETPANDIAPDADKIIKDGETLPLSTLIVAAIVRAIKASEAYERQGLGVDCSVFGVLLMGGTVRPVPDHVYRHGLWRTMLFGRYLEQPDAVAVTDQPQLIACGHVPGNRFRPLHITTKLPQVPDLFIQKTGHEMPIALTDALTTAMFYSSPVAATVDGLYAHRKNDPVLAYMSAYPADNPVGRYVGEPDLI